MGLIIRTTGLEDYAPGGQARIKVLTIGGPGAGKTRWASYFPKPIFADCEKGRAAIADRNVPYVDVLTSADMLDLLAHLKQDNRAPRDKRQFETVIIDTLDAYQRKLKDEWMQLNNAPVFTGWDAWGYLNSKMQLLMVRLLNLDMNVIVNVHFKDKTVKDDESGRESKELMLQLQGESADTTFNDFDLVGWMGTYWESVDGKRVQKRGLTFKAKPDKPFLKDRLHVTPDWMTVDFAPTDYTKLFEAIQSRVGDLSDGEVLGEIPSAVPDKPSMALPPGVIGSGPLAPSTPQDLPLAQLDKPTLLKRVRDAGITHTLGGDPIKANTLKAELLAALEAQHAPAPAAPAQTPAPQHDSGPAAAPAAAPTKPVQLEPAALPTEADTPQQESGYVLVDQATGQILDEDSDLAAAKAVVKEHLGGVEPAAQEQLTTRESAPPPAPAGTGEPEGICEDCGVDLAGEKQDFVKLSWIKYRKRLCQEHYQKRRNGS